MKLERYEDRINRAIGLIDREIDSDLSVEQLAAAACLSPYHFHRVFSALTGESVHALTTRMRMQRALSLTRRNERPRWKQIAGAVWFRSQDVFARAFQRHYGCSPSGFDLERWWRERSDRKPVFAVSDYFMRPAPDLPQDFTVTIVRWPAANLVVSRATGGYLNPERLVAAYGRLRDAATAHDWMLPNRLSGASRDDPERVPLSRCRYDFTLEVDGDAPLPRGLIRSCRAEGAWATTRVTGAMADVDRAWNLLFKSWLPRSGRELRDEPAEEIYHQTPETIGWDRFDLTLAIPLED